MAFRRLPQLNSSDPEINRWAAKLIVELERTLQEIENPINTEDTRYAVSSQGDSRDLRGATTLPQVKDVLTTLLQDIKTDGKIILE